MHPFTDSQMKAREGMHLGMMQSEGAAGEGRSQRCSMQGGWKGGNDLGRLNSAPIGKPLREASALLGLVEPLQPLTLAVTE